MTRSIRPLPCRVRAARPHTVLALAALALAVGACVGGPSESLIAPLPPPEAPRVTLDRQTDREHAKLVAAFGGEYRAPQARALVAEIAGRLTPATERPDETYQVTLLDSPAVNAFALPSGRLYVTRGLLALANDTAEVAAVLAHEIAHVTLRHAALRSEMELRSALVSKVVSDVLNDPVSSALVRDQSRFVIASFSRNQELEADQVGVRTLARARFDAYGAPRFLTSLGRATGAKGARGTPDMLSTHPSTPERVAQALQAARRIGAPGLGDADRARYLAAIDGLAYGDDPADGVVRGRRFIHPRLGVTFEAPPGLTLENTSRAVLGLSPDGNRRLLFDAVETAAGQSLESLLRSTWGDQVETSSVETLKVNDLEAATAVSKGNDWAFRLAAVRVGETTFRLVYATRALTPEMERAFRASLESVRAVPPEEARGLRPLRLQIVTAGEGDTVETLAGRMQGVDRPAERFALLNGLDRGDRVKAGERYKILVE